MLKNIFKILVIFILGIGGGIFGCQFLQPYFFEKEHFSPPPRPIQFIEKVEKKEIDQTVIEKAEKAVIAIKTETKKGKILEGSGFILTSDGLIVTLAELVPQGGKFSFFIDGKPASYQILKRDLKENLALIKVEKENLPTVSFAKLETLKLGKRVFLVGKILKPQGIKTTVNEGIVKYFDENLIETNILEKKNMTGSVLFDIEGNVLGINIVDEEQRIISLPVSKIRAFSGL